MNRNSRRRNCRVVAAMAFLLASCPAFADIATFQGLGVLPGGNSSYAYDVSADGSVVVGQSEGQAVSWQGTEIVSLGPVVANGVSADGSIVVGHDGSEACQWIQGTGKVGLGDVDGGQTYRSEATGVSSDGSIVVGHSNSPLGWVAWVWPQATSFA